MTPEQITIFAIIIGAIILFVWDKWRYDLVALTVLLAAVLTGVVPAKEAFTGLSDPVVITVATILVISAAAARSGFIDWSLKLMSGVTERPYMQITVLVALVVVLSGFMNNVGALAVFLPIALASAKKAGRSPSEMLMPLSFGSLLGGLITLIGTPPNLLISNIRQDIVGEPFQMFDFAPVGLGVCAAGVLYLTFGWKLIPKNRMPAATAEESFVIEDYISEVSVPEDSPIIGKTIADIENGIDGDFAICALIRNRYRQHAPSGNTLIQKRDILVVESDPVILKKLLDDAKLALMGSEEIENTPLNSDNVGVVEAVITNDSEMINATPKSLALRTRFGVNLLAARQTGKRGKERMRDIRLQSGDVVVLQGNLDYMPQTLRDLGCLPLAERKLLLGRDKKAILPVVILGLAVAATVLNIVPISIAFLAGVVAIGILRILRLSEMYEAIDAPVVILLAAMIPVTEALQSTGGSELIAGWISDFTKDFSAPIMLTIVLVASMLITPFLNNGATVLLMAPIAAGLAVKMNMNIDPFLMAVAIGTSCDFLTPIGHQSNTLVMGPGGYKFNDYWKMGLPLSILVVIVAVPLLLYFWPVHS